jgi:hypothetical protein
LDVEDAPPLPATREVFVRNPSFEANYAMAGETSAFEAGYQSDTPHGWIDGATGGRGLLNHEQLPISAPPDGTAANLYMNEGGLLYQVLGEALTADTTYTLLANLGWRADSAASGTFSPLLKFGTGTAVGGGVLTAISSSTPAPAAGGWESWTLTYETGANPTNLGVPLRIELHATGAQIQFDNIQLTALAAPAPPGLPLFSPWTLRFLALLMLASGALLARGRSCLECPADFSIRDQLVETLSRSQDPEKP